MHKTILTPAAFILILLVSSCVPARTAEPAGSPQPLSTADLGGKWKSEYGFYILFEDENGTFSGSYDEQSADAGLGILGTFALAGDQLSLVENEESESCPSLEGRFEAVLTRDDKLRLTILEDPCIYRVEGLFQGGQGGYRLLEFTRIKD